ncbi:MAG: PAS domain-containing protein [Anaerolineae bacterium]|nr:PAS domain-containing protein [Anaerolineae bacterium]
MFVDPSILLSSQAIVPLGITLIYLALCIFLFVRRKLDDAMDGLCAAYLFLSALWNVNLAAAVVNAPAIPGLSWTQVAGYGLVILGMVYWAFARAFLQRPGIAWWGWAMGLAGLAAMISLDLGWFVLPPSALAWSYGWLQPANLTFTLSMVWAGLFLAIAIVTTEVQYFRTQSPAHKNRISFLLISIVLSAVGYGLYLSLLEPFWTAGLIIACLGGILTIYIVVVEDLVDLSTAVRHTIRMLIVALVTVTVYLAGIYLVNIFLGNLLASMFLTRFLDRTLLVAAVTAVLLTIVYGPIRQISIRLANRLLFGQHYDYQVVIHNYSQAISNILYLSELSAVALTHIGQALGVENSTLFILDTEKDNVFNLRSVPPTSSNGSPKLISLSKNTPITNRLVIERQALAQYTIDISPQFKNAPTSECKALQALKAEWFIPILKQERLIGLLAVGLKQSGRAYSVQDIRLLTTLADQTALALENAALFDRLQRNLEQTTRMKNLMDNVFDSIDNGVITTDIAGKITLFNRAAEIIMATPAHRCIGFSYTDVLPNFAKTILPNLIKNVTHREDHYTDYEITSELPGRGQVNLNMNLAPLKDAQNQTQGVAIVVDDLTETKRLRAVQDMFRCYVSPAVVDRLPSDPADLKLGGNRQEVTILFADIRGFTTFSEKLAPEELVDVLNQYLSMAAASILMYEGTLDKFMGDAVMGIFNAPLRQDDHVLRAVRAAAAMQRAINDYHHSIGEERGLTFGIGLHVGEAVVGNVGMSDRMDYTAIGDTVNLAKRIQENTPGGKILVSEAVYQATKASINAVFYQEMKVKGREQPVNTYELRAM